MSWKGLRWFERTYQLRWVEKDYIDMKELRWVEKDYVDLKELKGVEKDYVDLKELIN